MLYCNLWIPADSFTRTVDRRSNGEIMCCPALWPQLSSMAKKKKTLATIRGGTNVLVSTNNIRNNIVREGWTVKITSVQLATSSHVLVIIPQRHLYLSSDVRMLRHRYFDSLLTCVRENLHTINVNAHQSLLPPRAMEGYFRQPAEDKIPKTRRDPFAWFSTSVLSPFPSHELAVPSAGCRTYPSWIVR